MTLSDVRIGPKLAGAFTVLVLTFMVASAAIWANLSTLATATKANEHAVLVLDRAADMMSDLVEQQNALRGFAASHDPHFTDNYARWGQAFAQALTEFRAANHNPRQAVRADEIARLATVFQSQAEALIAQARDPATSAQAAATLGSTARLIDTRKVMADLRAEEAALRDQRHAAEVSAFNSTQAVLLGGSGLAVALAAAFGWLLTRQIAAPVAAMTRAMKRLAAGDNTIEPPAVGRRDEVGDMAAAVQTFKAAALEKLRLEGEALAARAAAEAARQTHEAQALRAAEEQALVVGQLAEGLDRLSSYDLTYRIDQAFAPDYEKLRADFNAAIAQMAETIGVITGVAQGIHSGTREISTASDDLQHRTEQQAAGLEQTAAALDEITVTVTKTAAGADDARRVVGDAKADAERSGTVVRNAVEAMGRIEASSQQISQIIGVIDEIAFQTNLLALNAGVEAARAGDAGKGFAVVASEVRALAQRSAEAAKEIKTLISTSSEQVASGVQLVGETGEALDRIVAQVAQINGIVCEIAASAQEQASGLLQVNKAINQMDQTTQQNAAMVEQATAASRSLAQEAGELGRLVSQFRVEAVNRPAQVRAA
jgi:methyl-accepting chemotaxis protein